MIKKTLTYVDWNGESHVEDFYFNMSLSDIAELETSSGQDGFEANLKKILASEDGGAILKLIKDIVGRAYGQRSEDGKRFVKNDSIRDDFLSSSAYDALLMEFIEDPDKFIAFIQNSIPMDLLERLGNDSDQGKAVVSSSATEDLTEKSSAYPPEAKDMTREELLKAFAERNQGMLIKPNLK